MPLITVTQGGPDIDPGVYQVYLDKLEGPKTITPRSGPNAGVDVEIFDWTFVVEGGPYDETVINESTSTASGPHSKMYAWLTALFEGRSPQVGQNFEANDLVGLRALATINKNEAGWPRIVSLGAMPTSMRQAPPAPAPAPVAAAPVAAAPVAAPKRQAPPPRPAPPVAAAAAAPVAAPTDDLPF